MAIFPVSGAIKKTTLPEMNNEVTVGGRTVREGGHNTSWRRYWTASLGNLAFNCKQEMHSIFIREEQYRLINTHFLIRTEAKGTVVCFTRLN